MKKITTFLTFLFATLSIFAQSEIYEVRYSNFPIPTITVEGYASENLWVGCTISPDESDEWNFEPQAVWGGSFKVTFGGGERDEPVVVALWKEKLNVRDCERKYGEGSERCKWARENRYQMEGRVDTYRGIFRY